MVKLTEEQQVRIEALEAYGWGNDEAKTYVLSHPKPETLVENMAILKLAFKNLGREIVKAFKGEK